jgi:hypothetical protein
MQGAYQNLMQYRTRLFRSEVLAKLAVLQARRHSVSLVPQSNNTDSAPIEERVALLDKAIALLEDKVILAEDLIAENNRLGERISKMYEETSQQEKNDAKVAKISPLVVTRLRSGKQFDDVSGLDGSDSISCLSMAGIDYRIIPPTPRLSRSLSIYTLHIRLTGCRLIGTSLKASRPTLWTPQIALTMAAILLSNGTIKTAAASMATPSLTKKNMRALHT